MRNLLVAALCSTGLLTVFVGSSLIAPAEGNRYTSTAVKAVAALSMSSQPMNIVVANRKRPLEAVMTLPHHQPVQAVLVFADACEGSVDLSKCQESLACQLAAKGVATFHAETRRWYERG